MRSDKDLWYGFTMLSAASNKSLFAENRLPQILVCLHEAIRCSACRFQQSFSARC